MNSSQSTFSDADWSRIAGYLAGDLEGAERAEMEVWIAASPERVREIESLSNEWNNVTQRSLDEWDVDVGAEKVLSRIHTGGNHQKQPSSNWMRYGLAAAVVAVLLIVVNTQFISKEKQTPKTYSTALGQRAKINLPSGVQITLAPASKLSVVGNNAELEGQAVFTVLHKSNDPFTVRSGNAQVRVLGTTFSVRAYRGETVIQVIVAEGKVSANSVVLSGGDVATVTTSGVTRQSGVDVAAALSWTSGRLSFTETPLRDIIPDLNRWYNLDIRLGVATLGDLPVTGSFPEGNSNTLPGILEILLNARIVTQGRIITIYPR